MTIGELLVTYEHNHVLNLKDWRNISRRLQRHIAPWSALALGELTKMQVVQWHQEIGRTRGRTAANQAVQSLRAMYQKAQDWELYDGKNPANRIKRFPKQSRERFVQSHEMPWLLQSIAEELPRTETFFLCLLLTGARRDEARLMQWKDLDLDRALWHKPTTKTTPHTIPLPAQLVTKLLALPRVCAYVFPANPNPQNGMRAGVWCVTACEHAWGRIRRRAGLPDVRIHDLRRTAASWLSINGSNIQVISAMLNHKSLTSTQVYARLSVAPVRLALDDQAERMLGPVPTNRTPHPPMVMAASHEERDEWPG
jgi:integrase